jgi:hypothetical protein
LSPLENYLSSRVYYPMKWHGPRAFKTFAKASIPIRDINFSMLNVATISKECSLKGF